MPAVAIITVDTSCHFIAIHREQCGPGHVVDQHYHIIAPSSTFLSPYPSSFGHHRHCCHRCHCCFGHQSAAPLTICCSSMRSLMAFVASDRPSRCSSGHSVSSCTRGSVGRELSRRLQFIKWIRSTSSKALQASVKVLQTCWCQSGKVMQI